MSSVRRLIQRKRRDGTPRVRRVRLTRLIVRLAMIGGPVLASGCGETEPAIPRPRPAVAAPGPAYMIVVTDSTANYYSADVNTSVTGSRSGWNRADAYRQSVTHVVRTRNADGITWASTIGIDSIERMPVEQTGGTYHTDLGSTASAGTGSDPVVRDRAGNNFNPSLASASGVDLAPGVNAADVTPAGSPSANPWPAPSMGTVGSVSFSRASLGALPLGAVARPPRVGALRDAVSLSPAIRAQGQGWLDNVVVGPEARARWARRFAARFGAAKATVGGRDQYVLQRPNGFTELLVDPTIGAVVEENLVVDGQLRAHTTYTFDQVRSGVFVKHITRTELAPASGGPHVVLVTTLSHVTLEHHR